jgi:hypothetical protein
VDGTKAVFNGIELVNFWFPGDWFDSLPPSAASKRLRYVKEIETLALLLLLLIRLLLLQLRKKMGGRGRFLWQHRGCDTGGKTTFQISEDKSGRW